MRKKILAEFLSLIVVGMFVPVSASEGQIVDNIVNMIYWDQNEISTYWTGVTNLVPSSVNWFKPCVGVASSDVFTCGQIAYQSQYREHCFKTEYRHTHFLESKYGTSDYITDY